MMFCADWPHMWSGSTGPIHSWKRIGEILLLWRGNCIVTSTFSRKMHLNWKFCIIPCTGHFMWLFHFQLGCIHFCTYIWRICIQCIRKNTNQHFHVFQNTCRTHQPGVGGKLLRPISQELCYIYLPIHMQYPTSKIRSMQIFIISPPKTTFMT